MSKTPELQTSPPFRDDLLSLSQPRTASFYRKDPRAKQDQLSASDQSGSAVREDTFTTRAREHTL